MGGKMEPLMADLPGYQVRPQGDPGLLVFPGSIASQLEDLSRWGVMPMEKSCLLLLVTLLVVAVAMLRHGQL